MSYRIHCIGMLDWESRSWKLRSHLYLIRFTEILQNARVIGDEVEDLQQIFSKEREHNSLEWRDIFIKKWNIFEEDADGVNSRKNGKM